jgi:hypothetical protein
MKPTPNAMSTTAKGRAAAWTGAGRDRQCRFVPAAGQAKGNRDKEQEAREGREHLSFPSLDTGCVIGNNASSP